MRTSWSEDQILFTNKKDKPAAAADINLIVATMIDQTVDRTGPVLKVTADLFVTQKHNRRKS